MKKITIIFLILLIVFNLTLITEAKTNKIKVKINASGATITKDFNGVKLTVKTPKISKNKYIKLVNVVI